MVRKSFFGLTVVVMKFSMVLSTYLEACQRSKEDLQHTPLTSVHVDVGTCVVRDARRQEEENGGIAHLATCLFEVWGKHEVQEGWSLSAEKCGIIHDTYNSRYYLFVLNNNIITIYISKQSLTSIDALQVQYHLRLSWIIDKILLTCLVDTSSDPSSVQAKCRRSIEVNVLPSC